LGVRPTNSCRGNNLTPPETLSPDARQRSCLHAEVDLLEDEAARRAAAPGLLDHHRRKDIVLCDLLSTD